MGGADNEGFCAELVGELDTDERAAEGDVDDLAECGAGGEAGVCVGCGDDCGGPGADPVVWSGAGLCGEGWREEGRAGERV